MARISAAAEEGSPPRLIGRRSWWAPAEGWRILIAAAGMAVPALALGGSPPGAAACMGCHPVSANESPVLSLSTLSAEQIVTAMQAFRSGTRPATVMDRVAKGFSDEEVRAIARWYARAPAK